MTTTQDAPADVLDLSGEVLISADSHVMEEPDFWHSKLPDNLKGDVPEFPPRPKTGTEMDDQRPGGYDPNHRITEMETDGVSAEVLYPTLGLRLFSLESPEAQEACFRIYNDWLMEYCSIAPKRLVGIPCISTYDIDKAVAELHRTHEGGLYGALVWQVPFPEPELQFTSAHYDKLWAAMQELDVPAHLHILTGFDYSAHTNFGDRRGNHLLAHRGSVNLKLQSVTNSLFDLIFTGVFERFPKLKVVVVESEIGWIPFVLQQWDYYFKRFRESRPMPMTMLPSEYFYRNCYATFFNDYVGGQLLSWWGQDNCMWSTDYPHPNSPWPNSRRVLAENLGHLPVETIHKLVNTNVRKLYPIAG